MISFIKQPAEKISKGFRPDLPNGVTISSCTVGAINLATGASDTSVIGSTTATLLETNTAFAVLCQAGSEGTDYKITFTYTRSDAEIGQENLLMRVKSEPV